MGIHEREHLEISNHLELTKWLEVHHGTSPGLWIVTYKKASGMPSPTYDEIVRAALSFGWIDSIPGKVDALRSKLYISPRKPKSAWSKANKDRVLELLAAGQMAPAGLAVVEAAKKSGTWALIDSAQNLEIPDDLDAEFQKHRGSRANFEAFPQGVRKQILEWIVQAKTPGTREKRILETASKAAENLRANQWRNKSATDAN